MPGGFDPQLLLQKLLQGADSRPLDDLISELMSKIQPSRIYALCSAFANLLTESKVFTPTQRLFGFAFLHQAYSSEQPSSNPFTFVLVNAASNEEAENFERGFILQLLGSTSHTNIAEFLKLSAADFIRNFDPSSHTFPPSEQLRQQYCSKVGPEQFGSLSRNRVMNILPDPDVPHGCDINSTEFDLQPGVTPKIGSGARDETISALLQNLSVEGLRPQWIRPRPPRLPVLEGEMVWLNPDNTHELIWDDGMCKTVEPLVKDLIAKGLKGPLEPTEEKQVLLQLGDDPPLPPYELPELVKNNPNIAAEILTKLEDPSKFQLYYGALFGMELDSKLIEVVNKLNKAGKIDTQAVALWTDFGLMVLRDIKDGDPQEVFDSLFMLGELPSIKKRVDLDMIEKPLANFWAQIKDGDTQAAFRFLFRLAEFPRIKEQFIRLVDDSGMIDKYFAAPPPPTPEFIQCFIKSCIPSRFQSKDKRLNAKILLDFLRKLIKGRIIQGPPIHPSPR